ncbi:MAG: hypothetical protein ACXABY_07495 [Candidatus Thorarchaeota archaeon]|jgi:hypothetical protein
MQFISDPNAAVSQSLDLLVDLNNAPLEDVRDCLSRKAYNMAMIKRVGLPHTPLLYLIPYWVINDRDSQSQLAIQVSMVNRLARDLGFKLSIRGAHVVKLRGSDIPDYPFDYRICLSEIDVETIHKLVETTKSRLLARPGRAIEFLPNIILSSYHRPIKSGGIVRVRGTVYVEAIWGDPVGILRMNLPCDRIEYSNSDKLVFHVERKTRAVQYENGTLRTETAPRLQQKEQVMAPEEICYILDLFAQARNKNPAISGTHWLIAEDVGLVFFRMDTSRNQGAGV